MPWALTKRRRRRGGGRRRRRRKYGFLCVDFHESQIA
jgi:hypothetical protein